MTQTSVTTATTFEQGSDDALASALDQQYRTALRSATTDHVGEAARLMAELHRRVADDGAEPAVRELLMCVCEQFELEWRRRQR